MTESEIRQNNLREALNYLDNAISALFRIKKSNERIDVDGIIDSLKKVQIFLNSQQSN
jgi:hypothetical protein